MKPIWELKSIKEAASRPEFYRFLNVGLRDLLFNAYKEQPSTYEQIVTIPPDSDKAKEGYPSLGAVDLPDRVLEGEPAPEKTAPQDDMVEVTNHKFAEILAITEELIDDDQTGRIRQLPQGMGQAARKKEDKTVYSIINGNATGYDSVAWFSLNHPGYTGGPTIAENDNIYTNVTLTANAIATVLGMIAGWTGHTREDILDVTAMDLIVPENLLFTAQILTTSDVLPLAYAAGVFGPAASIGSAPNVLKTKRLGVIASPRLDRTSTTDWYVKTDFPGFIFQWRKRLEFLAENENSGVRFERGVYRWKIQERWRAQVINWRAMLKVS